MQRIIPIMVIVVASVAAAAAISFWAFRPLGFVSYLSSVDATHADIIRQYWPYRLVQPEWVSATPDRLMNWHMAEVGARLSFVGMLWLLISGGAAYRIIRGQRFRPNQGATANPDAA